MEVVMLQLPEIHKLIPEIMIGIIGGILEESYWFPVKKPDPRLEKYKEAALEVISQIVYDSIPEITKPAEFTVHHLLFVSLNNTIMALTSSNVTRRRELLKVINDRGMSTDDMLKVQQVIDRVTTKLRRSLSDVVRNLISWGRIDFTAKDYQQCCVEHNFGTEIEDPDNNPFY